MKLARARDLGELLSDTFAVLRAWPAQFLAASAAIVVPVQLTVSGIGLERLSSGAREKVSAAETAIPTAVTFFVIAPLVTAAAIHLLSAAAEGRKPQVAASLQAALDDFAPVFLAVLFVAIGVVVGLAALLLPGVYLLIRWFFATQCVVIEGKRGFDALARSGELVHDNWWRCLGIVLAGQLVAALPGFLLTIPMTAAADAADAEALSLAGDIAAATVSVPIVAVLTTLLFYDLKARREALRA